MVKGLLEFQLGQMTKAMAHLDRAVLDLNDLHPSAPTPPRQEAA
jgi:hypothetical protein